MCLKSQTRQLPGKFEIYLGRNVVHFLETCVPHVEIPHGWTDVIYHVGLPLEYRSISEGYFIAGGDSKRVSVQPWTP